MDRLRSSAWLGNRATDGLGSMADCWSRLMTRLASLCALAALCLASSAIVAAELYDATASPSISPLASQPACAGNRCCSCTGTRRDSSSDPNYRKNFWEDADEIPCWRSSI